VGDELERHLARCRRSGSSAALLVARVGRGAGFPAGLERRLRISDSAAFTRADELALLCDASAGGAPLDRAAVERRLRELAGDRLRCSWASFPEDGPAVDDLLRAARARSAGAYALTAPTLLAETG